MSTIPDTVIGDDARSLYADANDIRADLKRIGKDLSLLRLLSVQLHPGNGEAAANATLAFRHVEDASMRLGKLLQSLDGGISVYDKATTVGAPDTTEGRDAVLQSVADERARPINRDDAGNPIFDTSAKDGAPLAPVGG